MEKKIDAVEFEDDALHMVLELYGKEIDDLGKIIDKNIGDIEIDEYAHEEITQNNFGGVLVGSKIFVTKNSASFAEHISKFCKNE